jgi:hypothetical protein
LFSFLSPFFYLPFFLFPSAGAVFENISGGKPTTYSFHIFAAKRVPPGARFAFRLILPLII